MPNEKPQGLTLRLVPLGQYSFRPRKAALELSEQLDHPQQLRLSISTTRAALRRLGSPGSAKSIKLRDGRNGQDVKVLQNVADI